MNRGPGISLRDILEAAELLAQYVDDLAWEMVQQDVPELAERVREILAGLDHP